MTDIWDELWEDIEWDRVTTIPFITERIHEIKAVGDRLNSQLEAVKKQLVEFPCVHIQDYQRIMRKIENILEAGE